MVRCCRTCPHVASSLQVRATDEDGNRNGDIRYAISDSNNFSIDDVTGTITTGTANDSNTTLLYDYESGVTVYRFSVYAIGEPNTSTASH